MAEFTKMVKLWVALKLGVPLSATLMLTTLVLGDCALLGVQVNTPLELSRLAPVGAPAPRLKIRIWAGRSGSLTTLLTVNNCPAATVLFAIGERIGAEFTSLTMMVKRWVALKLGLPLSKTRTRMLLLLGPWASLGVQVNTPLLELTDAPAGAETISYVRMLVGTSTSVALLVKVIGVSSLIVAVVLFRLFRTGATFTSLTTMVKL